jgi:hypothetical protein
MVGVFSDRRIVDHLGHAAEVLTYEFRRDGHKIREFPKSWRAASRKAGIGDRFLHDFRRTAVRNMVRAGDRPERFLGQYFESTSLRIRLAGESNS